MPAGRQNNLLRSGKSHALTPFSVLSGGDPLSLFKIAVKVSLVVESAEPGDLFSLKACLEQVFFRQVQTALEEILPGREVEILFKKMGEAAGG